MIKESHYSISEYMSRIIDVVTLDHWSLDDINTYHSKYTFNYVLLWTVLM